MRYNNAITYFLEVLDYSDAREQALDSGYLKAVNDYNSGNNEEAYEIFCAIKSVIDVQSYFYVMNKGNGSGMPKR